MANSPRAYVHNKYSASATAKSREDSSIKVQQIILHCDCGIARDSYAVIRVKNDCHVEHIIPCEVCAVGITD